MSEVNFFAGLDATPDPAHKTEAAPPDFPDPMVSDPQLPYKPDPMDPQPLLNLFTRFREEIDAMANKSQGHQVTDDESSAQAAEMASQALGLKQIIEKKRKEVTRPYLDVKKAVDSGCKMLTDHLLNIKRHLEQLNTPYLAEKRRQQREEEARLRREAAEAEAARKKAAAQAEAAGAPAPETQPVVAPVLKPVQAETATGKQTFKEVPQWKVTDWAALINAALPTREKELLKAVAPYINAQIKATNHHIPGVEWTMVRELQTRTKRSGGRW